MKSPDNYIKLSMHLSRSTNLSQVITEEEMDLWMDKFFQWLEAEGEYECAFGMWSLVNEDEEEE